MLKDPDFLAAAEKRNLMVDPGTGEELDALVRDTLKLPQDVAVKIGKMMESGKRLVGWAKALALMFHTAKSRVRFAHHQHQCDVARSMVGTAHVRPSLH
jgi:hypothetical protein